MPRRTVYVVDGIDPSSVYHSRQDCPALRGRIGWLAMVYKAQLHPDGTVRWKSLSRQKAQRRTPCKRCHR